MWPNLQFAADLATFTEEIFNRKLHFLCSRTMWFKNDIITKMKSKGRAILVQMIFGNCLVSIKQRHILNALCKEVFHLQVGAILMNIFHSCFLMFLLLIRYIFTRSLLYADNQNKGESQQYILTIDVFT